MGDRKRNAEYLILFQIIEDGPHGGSCQRYEIFFGRRVCMDVFFSAYAIYQGVQVLVADWFQANHHTGRINTFHDFLRIGSRHNELNTRVRFHIIEKNLLGLFIHFIQAVYDDLLIGGGLTKRFHFVTVVLDALFLEDVDEKNLVGVNVLDEEGGKGGLAGSFRTEEEDVGMVGKGRF